MRIKKIHIIKYGPINGLDLDIGPGLQVIMGKNEAGKTLTVEAAIKMLLEGKTRDFDDIDRVSEEPEGYILFEDEDGIEQKINLKNGLFRHMDLRGLDLRNIFIIRDSDLTLRDEYGYYKNITDKLTGLQLEKIEEIMSSVQDFGRLVNPSSDSKLSNAMEHGKIAALRSQAVSFEGESREYIRSSGSQKLDYLELEQVNTRQEIKKTRDAIRGAEEALKWENYQKNVSSLEKLHKQWETYIEYRDFSQANYEKISELNINLDSIREKISRASTGREKSISQREILMEKLAKVQSRLDVFEEKKRDIDRLKSDLEIYNRRKAEEIKEPGRFSQIINVILFLLAPLSFPAVYMPTRSLPYSSILPILFLIAGIVIFAVNRQGIKSGRLTVDGKLLENEFRKIGFKIKSLDEILPAAAGFEDGYMEIAGERNSLRDQIRLMEMEENRISDSLDDDIKNRRLLELELEEIMAGLGISNTGEFIDKRKIKNRAASGMIATAKMIQEGSNKIFTIYDLDREIDDTAGDMENILRLWEEEIAGSKPQGEYFKENITVSKTQVEDLKSGLELLEERLSSLDIKLEDHRKNLGDFQRRFSALDLSGYLDNFKEIGINSLGRLKEAADLAENFICLIDRQYNIAVEAIKIFESIRDTEETKVSELFERLEISAIFEEITEGKYKDVRFDSQGGKVLVVDGQGKELPAENLSKGAYDQLFLSVRIAISEEILGGGNGFFILDDAFLSSDNVRLVRQFKVLKKLADRGWSIIYFSVKDEIAQLSAKFTKNKILEIK